MRVRPVGRNSGKMSGAGVQCVRTGPRLPLQPTPRGARLAGDDSVLHDTTEPGRKRAHSVLWTPLRTSDALRVRYGGALRSCSRFEACPYSLIGPAEHPAVPRWVRCEIVSFSFLFLCYAEVGAQECQRMITEHPSARIVPAVPLRAVDSERRRDLDDAGRV